MTAFYSELLLSGVFGLDGSEPRCSPSFVVCDTREVGFLTESVTPVVSHLYEEGITALLLRLLDSKITPGSSLIGPSFAAEKSLWLHDA